MKYQLLFALIACNLYVYAKHYRMHPGVPTDSSYNLADQVVKMTPKYPFIRLAVPYVSDSIQVFENLVYETLGKRELHLDVFQPTYSLKKTPVVVLVQGGGWRSDNANVGSGNPSFGIVKPNAGALWFGVSSSVDSTLWIEASALTHVGAQSAPFLYIRSSIPRYTAGYVEMMTVLRSKGIYCEEHLLEGTPHSFWLFHPWVDETMLYAVSFLKKVL